MSNQLAEAQTNKFVGGQFEARIGTLVNAGRLAAANSIGLVDSFEIKIAPEFADFFAGSPQYQFDSMPSKVTADLTIASKEYSNRNLNITLNNGVSDFNTGGGDVLGVVDTTSAIAAGEDTLVLTGTPGSFAAGGGDLVTIYSTTNPGKTTTALTLSYTSGTKTLVLATGNELLEGYDAGEVVKVYKNAIVSGGNIVGVNYFTVSILTLDRGTGRSVMHTFWKCAMGSGLDYKQSSTDWSASDWTIKLLKPTKSDIATGGPLHSVASRVAASPVYEFATVLDFL